MRYATKYSFLLIWLVSTLSFAQAPGEEQAKPEENCLTIQGDYVSLIDSGKYRYASEGDNKAESEPLVRVNFKKLSNYQQYLAEAYQVIENRNPRASMPCPIVTDTYQQLAKQNNWEKTPSISQLVAPYELAQSNNDKAILLIHGLTDSPFSFHDLSQYFYQQGFTVRTLLMPGHSTAPSDLLDVDYSEWQEAAQFAIDNTLNDYEEVYLGGLSTGGALIFGYLSEQKQIDKKIKGLFMWSPASKAKNDLAWLATYVDMVPFVNWIDLDADIDFAKYESFPYNAAAQVDGIMTLVFSDDTEPKNTAREIPLFIVASEHDETIDTEQTLKLVQQRQLASPQKQRNKSVLIYYGDNTKLPSKLPSLMNVIVPECTSQSLCSDIFDVSHIATTNSPDNPHYGVKGQYRNCGHYINDASKYKACKNHKQVIKGEVTEMNLSRGVPIQRLTYNPYYDEMLTEMTNFLTATH